MHMIVSSSKKSTFIMFRDLIVSTSWTEDCNTATARGFEGWSETVALWLSADLHCRKIYTAFWFRMVVIIWHEDRHCGADSGIWARWNWTRSFSNIETMFERRDKQYHHHQIFFAFSKWLIDLALWNVGNHRCVWRCRTWHAKPQHIELSLQQRVQRYHGNNWRYH